MLYNTILTVYFFMWYLLIFTAILFLVSGLDDLFFDIVYWLHYLWRKYAKKHYHYADLTYEQLAEFPERSIAVLLPCWQEANVIDIMLRHNCLSIDYGDYDIFIGVYPNDPETIASVKSVAKDNPHIHCVIGTVPGPTNKADNLNQIYHYIEQYAKEQHKTYAIFVFHDSEDVIHPLSFKLYNYLIDKFDMIQVPVFPLEPSLLNFTHWVYNDEFSEIHTKDLVVRELIGGLVPSAGVGTAFSKKAVEMLSKNHDNNPFITTTLTEDYNTALQIRVAGLKQIFLVQQVWRTKLRKRFIFFGRYIPVRIKEYIATRALFPMEYQKAVRQKTRWILGISIQEWAQTGWIGNRGTLYTLIHDRKASFTHLLNMLSYVIFLFWLIYSICVNNKPYYPSLQEQFNDHPWVWVLVMTCTVLMLNRFLQRTIACYRIYGIVPALLCIPRIFYGNLLNLHALARAYMQYLLSSKTKGNARWDKTEHHFPGSHILVAYKKRLGDLAIENGFIRPEQLTRLLSEQNRQGLPLGELLKKYAFINAWQLTQLLSQQYNLPIVRLKSLEALPLSEIPGLSSHHYHWLIHQGCYPIAYHPEPSTLTIAINDPFNQPLIQEIYNHLSTFKVVFSLIELSDKKKVGV